MTDATTYEPGRTISLVLALLDQRWPPIGALDDSPSGDVLAKLASAPRYLVGRLQQAMTVLLADDLPPVDPQSALLSRPSTMPSPGAPTKTANAPNATNGATNSATNAPPITTRPAATMTWPARSVW
jgi:hypothetical protein